MFPRLFSRKHRALCILITRVADLRSRITEEEDDRMSELLKCLQLHERHHMSDVYLRSDGIDPELHDELLSCEKTFLEMFTLDTVRDGFREEILHL